MSAASVKALNGLLNEFRNMCCVRATFGYVSAQLLKSELEERT